MARLFAGAGALKEVPRQGWIDKAAVGRPESVADHSYGTAVMAMAAGDALGMDTLRMVRMALLHDLAESITGDLVPGEVPAGEKKRREEAAMSEILEGLPGALRREYAEAWAEFEGGATAEAAMVREIDKAEMAMQAAAYAEAGRGRADRLGAFVEYAGRAVSSPAGRALLAGAAGRCRAARGAEGGRGGGGGA